MKANIQLTDNFKVNKPFLHKWRPSVSFGLILWTHKYYPRKEVIRKYFMQIWIGVFVQAKSETVAVTTSHATRTCCSFDFRDSGHIYDF